VSTENRTALKPADLPVAIYLNQRLVFDLLAVFEDGLAQVERLETSTGGGTSSDASAALGVGNPFALIGVKLRGDIKAAKTASETQVRTEELIHTPTSLAARLVSYLREDGLLRDIAGPNDLKTIAVGDFVEFAGVLRRSPLFDTLATLKNLVNVFAAFQGAQKPANVTQKKSAPGGSAEPSPAQMGKMVDAIVSSVDSGDSYDLVASLAGVDGARAVLTAERAFFVDPTLNSLLDGTFRVLAKVTRVLPDGSDEAINLFRKSSLGKLAPQLTGDLVAQLQQAFPTAGQRDEPVAEVTAPALQAIPIIVYA
jgi:hypothetical protein